MAVACSVAKTKPNVEVRAIYGIEVPRTLPVNAEMPEKTRLAEETVRDRRPYAIPHLEPGRSTTRDRPGSLGHHGRRHVARTIADSR